MFNHRNGLGFTDFAIKQRRAFSLAEFIPAAPTAQIPNPVGSIGLAHRQVGLAALAVGLALGIETTQILQRWSWLFHLYPSLLGGLE